MKIESLIDSIEEKYMEELLLKFSEWDRLSGTSEAKAAAGYITEKLNDFGIENKCYEFESYVSDPVSSRFVLLENGNKTEFMSRPRSFAANVPEGLLGELWYDEDGTVSGILHTDSAKLKGKLVVSYNYDEEYVKTLSDRGASGLVQIWTSDEDIIHEDTVGCVWGTPTTKTYKVLPKIPVVGIKYRDGQVLLEKMKNASCMGEIATEINCHLQTLQLPVAVIHGKTPDFVLLSGHYDSWYYGATDNGTGNALCLELARVFQKHSKQLEKSVMVAWWPGHSNGRYSGSTWFCDQNWELLNNHCYGHINIDSPGCMGAERVVMGTTRFEGTKYTSEIIQKHTGMEPKGYSQLFKGADQSFFGCRIPIHIYPMYKQADENKVYASPGSGGGWWWHTPADTLDKVDSRILLRDTKYIAHMLGGMVFEPVIPSNCEEYFKYIEATIGEYERNSDAQFSFAEVQAEIKRLKNTWNESLAKCQGTIEEENLLLKLLGGELNRLMNSCSERYEFDLAMSVPLFSGLGIPSGIKKEDCPPEEFLFIATEFQRQKNRFVNELKNLEREIKYIATEHISREEAANVSLHF